MARSGKGRSSSGSKSFGLAGIGEKQNPAARKSQETSSRDSVDRQGRFESPVPRTGMPSTHTQYRESHLAGLRSTWPEGSTQTRKAEVGIPAGTDYGTAAIKRSKAAQAESTWAVPDLGPGRGRAQPKASSYNRAKSSAQGDLRNARLGIGMGMPRSDRSGIQATYREADRSGIRAAEDSEMGAYRRKEKAQDTRETYRAADSAPIERQSDSFRREEKRAIRTAENTSGYRAADSGMMDAQPEASGGRTVYATSGQHRQASTESAYRAADASIINSNVTPKAAPLKDYKPRGKTVRNENIQAFY